jgi:hypothetical protein
VVFTSKDDNAVGESFGTGTPAGFYGNPMLSLASASCPNAMIGLRMSYARTAISCTSGNYNFYCAQFVKCQDGFSLTAANVFLGNALFANTLTNFIVQAGATVNAQNTTFSGSSYLATGPSSQQGCHLALTNCILANVTNLVSGLLAATNGNYNGFYNAPYLASLAPVSFTNTLSPFQCAGAASYYLTNGCGFLYTGTTILDPVTLSLIQQRTTSVPLIYSNITFSVVTNFGPQAPRDAYGPPCLGWHYDPLDYIFGNVIVQSNVLFTAGTAVGWFEANGTMTGISLTTGGSLTFQGTVTAPCNFARYYNVQEGGNGIWTAKGYLGGIVFNGNNAANPPLLMAQFTKFEGVAGSPCQFRDNSTYGEVGVADSEIYGGNIGSYGSSYYFTNCLFCHVDTAFWAQVNAGSCAFQNCVFDGGYLALVRYSGQSASFWNIENTAFEGTAFAYADNYNGTSCTLFNYNAYNTNNLSWQTYNSGGPTTNTLEVVGAQSIMVTNYNWQSSWFGNYYIPPGSPLIQQGSTNANLLGLYHFTTQTNQVPETNSLVTIGYHYVATNTNGVPLDTNGDGIPDYFEDANGNGLVDSGEIGWNIPGDLGLQVIISRPRNGSNLP